MKVFIDQDKRVASGQCVLATAALFDQRDEDGIVVLLTDNPTGPKTSGRPLRSAGPSDLGRRGVTGVGPIVIVGAPAAGLTAAETLRRRGFDGNLTLVGDEPHPPYDRPPRRAAGGRAAGPGAAGKCRRRP